MLHYVHVRKRKNIFTAVASLSGDRGNIYEAKPIVCVKGGATVGYGFDDERQQLMYAVSRCSKKDNFCKRLGRELVEERLGGLVPVNSPMDAVRFVEYKELPEGKPTYKNIAAYFNNLLKDC